MRADRDNTARVLSALDAQPATLRSLAIRTGLPRRRVEEAIEAIRKAGLVAVCSGPEGVWLARSVSEAAENIEARRRRAITQLQTVRAERKLVRRLNAPSPTLWEGVA